MPRHHRTGWTLKPSARSVSLPLDRASTGEPDERTLADRAQTRTWKKRVRSGLGRTIRVELDRVTLIRTRCSRLVQPSFSRFNSIPVPIQYLTRIEMIFPKSLHSLVPLLSSRRQHATESTPRMSLPSVDPKNPPAWLCVCTKCGSDGKALPRRTWYTHNPGGKAAKYNVFANPDIPPPVRKLRKRQRREEEVEEVEEVEVVEDLPHSRAGGSSSVCLCCIYAHRSNDIQGNLYLGSSS